MDSNTALEAFKDLEAYKRLEPPPEEEGEGQEELPVYGVRLDASVDDCGERGYRLRVTPGCVAVWDGTEDWGQVFNLAREYGLDVQIQNNAAELV